MAFPFAERHGVCSLQTNQKHRYLPDTTLAEGENHARQDELPGLRQDAFGAGHRHGQEGQVPSVRPDHGCAGSMPDAGEIGAPPRLPRPSARNRRPTLAKAGSTTCRVRPPRRRLQVQVKDVRRPCPTCGELIIATAARCRFCRAVFDPRRIGSSIYGGQGYAGLAISQGEAVERSKQIRQLFTAWWICLAVGIALCLTVYGAIVGFPTLLGASCRLLCSAIQVMVYRPGWCALESTPGQAVGFCFIPCFNLYWQFVAFWGLSKDLNRYAALRTVSKPPTRTKGSP